jgi:sulfate adenylyltransferase
LGYVASEITKHGGIAICAAIAPYEAARQKVREQVAQYGAFIEIYVSTPLTVCQERDTKGLYQKAKAGQVSGVTGVDAPYEVPGHPEISIDTSHMTVLTALEKITNHLKTQGVLLDVERIREHA